MTEIYDLLNTVQMHLKVPKKRRNKFQNYDYRNAEDILEALKEVMPLGCTVTLSDSIEYIGSRYYMKAEASFNYKGQSIKAYGWAREAEEKKGSDASQITGGCSTYSRRYALSGLFAIDDGIDTDMRDNSNEGHSNASQAAYRQDSRPKQQAELKPLTVKQSQILETLELYEGEKDVAGVRDYWNKCDKADREAIKPHMRKPLKDWLIKIVTAPTPEEYLRA